MAHRSAAVSSSRVTPGQCGRVEPRGEAGPGRGSRAGGPEVLAPVAAERAERPGRRQGFGREPLQLHPPS
jgi:hypothetical protein